MLEGSPDSRSMPLAWFQKFLLGKSLKNGLDRSFCLKLSIFGCFWLLWGSDRRLVGSQMCGAAFLDVDEREWSGKFGLGKNLGPLRHDSTTFLRCQRKWVHFEGVSHVYADASDFVSNPGTVQLVNSLTISSCLPPLQMECFLTWRGLDLDGLTLWLMVWLW